MRLNDDARFRIMRLIDANPGISQRQLARTLGASLGGINYCLAALIDHGWLKMCRFRDAEAKLCYAYALTPMGLAEKSRLAQGFVARKTMECDALRAEIESVEKELCQGVAPLA